MRRPWGYLVLALLVFAADQGSKALVQHTLGAHRYLPLAGEVLGLRLVLNKGAAFGLFASGGPVLLGVTIAAIGVILYYSRHAGHLHRWVLPAFALQLGGALGNLLDRLRLGSVVDFIYVSFWPTFNVADIGITAGALLLIYCLVTAEGAGRKAEGEGG